MSTTGGATQDKNLFGEDVPPEPTPVTKTSSSPSVSSQISSAVVLACTSGFAGFSNCAGMNAPGVSSRSCSARSTAPAIPSSAGVRMISAP